MNTLNNSSNFGAFQHESECTHNRKVTVKFLMSNGRAQLVDQCLDCGEKVGNFLKQAGWDLDKLAWFDKELQQTQRAQRQQKRDELRYRYLDELERQRLSQQEKYWANYNRYLQSSHWRQLRRSVIHRDQFRCQNCFRKITETTAHVHHTSYVGFRRLGKSFAFECVTLCANCHTEFHPHMSDMGDDYG